jgi:hypothetical protein
LVVQKIGAQYLIKRVSDYVTAPPPPAAGPTETETVSSAAAEETVVDLLDGQPLKDEDGQTVGIARRVREVAVYFVGEGFGDRVQTLQEAIDDPDTKILFHSVDNRLAGIIYVPDPSKRQAKSSGMRADDV